MLMLNNYCSVGWQLMYVFTELIKEFWNNVTKPQEHIYTHVVYTVRIVVGALNQQFGLVMLMNSILSSSALAEKVYEQCTLLLLISIEEESVTAPLNAKQILP